MQQQRFSTVSDCADSATMLPKTMLALNQCCQRQRWYRMGNLSAITTNKGGLWDITDVVIKKFLKNQQWQPCRGMNGVWDTDDCGWISSVSDIADTNKTTPSQIMNLNSCLSPWKRNYLPSISVRTQSLYIYYRKQLQNFQLTWTENRIGWFTLYEFSITRLQIRVGDIKLMF